MRSVQRFSRASILALLLAGGFSFAAQAEARLEGTVTSQAEGAMGGVLVSAKKDGTIITTTVVTDDKGHYAFPSDRVSPGHYALSIRAVGYDLQGPNAIDVVDGKTTSANLTLEITKDLESQLTNAEWISSAPLPDKDKAFLTGCVECHTLARPMQSKFTEAEWPDFIKLMASLSAESTPDHQQYLIPGPRNRLPDEKRLSTLSKALAQINLSQGKRSYPLQTTPRPSGRARNVIITEYDLPTKEWWPHDVILDKEGNIWFDDFGDQFVGKMDGKTLEVTAIPLPIVKDDGSPLGNLDIEWGPDGHLWVAEMYQAAIAEIDPKTLQVKTYKLPDEIQNPSTQSSFVAPQHSDVDGYVWSTNQDDHSAWRLNLKTGKFEKGSDEKDAAGNKFPAYQIVSDSKNGIYLLNFGGTWVGHVDAKTGIAEGFKTPTPNGRPRRGVVDSKDRVWYSEPGANSIGMFDPQTRKITEWPVPSKWGEPYGLDYSDKYNEAWTGAGQTDKVSRLEVKSDEITEYLLPHSTNIRRVFIDNRGKLPVLWVGNNHAAQIIKVEPLD